MTDEPPNSGKTPLRPQLWIERPVEDTMAVYADWAATYDRDLTERGYHTPGRIAEALRAAMPRQFGPILDFGCGTGIGGVALRLAGFDRIHGTDISVEMLAKAQEKRVYDSAWVSTPGAPLAEPGAFAAIVAVGVISLGAAPPETLDLLVAAAGPDTLIALSFNDPSLAAGSYDRRLQHHLDAGDLRLVSRAHGPHLDDLEMGSDVIVLVRQ